MKILPLMSSGSNQMIVDTETNNVDKLHLINIDLYVQTAPDDLTMIDKNSNPYIVKKGDVILKSHCRNMYFVLKPEDTIIDFLKQYNNTLDESKKNMSEFDGPLSENPSSIGKESKSETFNI